MINQWKINKMRGLLPLLAIFLMPTACLFQEKEEVTEEDRQQAEELTEEAATSLESTFNQLNSGDFAYGQSEWPGMLDAHSEFEEATKLDPDNSEAKFGHAMTSFMLAVQAENVHTLLDEAGVTSPMELALNTKMLDMQQSVMVAAAKRSEFPEFHEFQDAIADSVLPVLDQAIDDLTLVYEDENFSLTITMDGEAKEIDRVEAGLILAGFKILRAFITIPLSYDIDVDDEGSYDYISVIEGIGDIADFSQLTPEQEAAFNHVTALLTPGSSFLTVREEYEERLSKVHDELNEAVNLAKDILDMIPEETDDQADDILRMCSTDIEFDCIQSAEMEDVQNVLDSVLKYIGGPVNVEVPELDTILKLNPSVLLGQIQDFKKLLPYYGFYPASEWSEDKPVFYFTDADGNTTGNIKTLNDIFVQDSASGDTTEITVEEAVAEIREIIILQDPTFQGLFHNGTEDGFWELFIRMVNNSNTNEEEIFINDSTGVQDTIPVTTSKKVIRTLMDPKFSMKLWAR